MNYLLLCLFLIYAVPALSFQTPAQKKSKGLHEPCNLLTSAEIASVLGEPVKDSKSSTQPGSGLLMSQCFFGMATSAKSVSVAVASANPAANPKLTPREFWRKQFHSPSHKDTRAEAEGEGDLSKPRTIPGIGEEAYWVGNAISGALYVLQGDTFLRVSVGGIRQEPERIEKSKALARAAIKRL
jgi:hypothetical protein